VPALAEDLKHALAAAAVALWRPRAGGVHRNPTKWGIRAAFARNHETKYI